MNRLIGTVYSIETETFTLLIQLFIVSVWTKRTLFTIHEHLSRAPESTPAGIDCSASARHSLCWILWCWCGQMLPPPHSLHLILIVTLMRWCWQMLAPPHSLHWLLMHWCLCDSLCPVCRGRYGLGGGVLLFILGSKLGGVGLDRGLRGGGRRGWCEEWARRS